MSEGGCKRATDRWAVSTAECEASTEGVGESWGADGEVGKGCKESTARWTALRGGWASYRLVICAFVAAAALPLAKERDKESFQYSLGDSHGGEPYVRCGSLLMALNGMPASCFCDWMNMDGHLCMRLLPHGKSYVHTGIANLGNSPAGYWSEKRATAQRHSTFTTPYDLLNCPCIVVICRNPHSHPNPDPVKNQTYVLCGIEGNEIVGGVNVRNGHFYMQPRPQVAERPMVMAVIYGTKSHGMRKIISQLSKSGDRGEMGMLPGT
ncbi:hypothetical protein B0H14DRAFT_2599955 [Mycena olivaceomarginata]|nr:hypothetical protein B0H14DRAFT_2599955 [Mycena olivaceomarginata]